TRSKVNVAFPSSPLDLAAAGISAIGVVQLGSRAVPLFRQGNKVFDADELAKGTWQQAKPIEKLDEYSAAEWRVFLEQKYGTQNVVSTTIPSSESRWFKLRNTQNPQTRIWYNERGHPIFDPVAKFDTRVPDRIRWNPDPRTHQSEATRQLKVAIDSGQVNPRLFAPDELAAIYSGRSTIPRYRWHHHQEFGRMQLVPEDIHTKTTHIGGMGMQKGQ
ncbi:MAG TPA: HNH endonuclease, partial [Burkholderiales bacterium]|nr:HNH endonuclease [Burkholderiales bacterium]